VARKFYDLGNGQNICEGVVSIGTIFIDGFQTSGSTVRYCCSYYCYSYYYYYCSWISIIWLWHLCPHVLQATQKY